MEENATVETHSGREVLLSQRATAICLVMEPLQRFVVQGIG
jgi:hypothetical protein